MKNVEDTIALAGNYVDSINWEAMISEMKGVIRGEPVRVWVRVRVLESAVVFYFEFNPGFSI